MFCAQLHRKIYRYTLKDVKKTNRSISLNLLWSCLITNCHNCSQEQMFATTSKSLFAQSKTWSIPHLSHNSEMSTPKPYLIETEAPTRAEIDSLQGLTLLEFGTDWCALRMPATSWLR